MIDTATYADDQRLRDANAALGDACEAPAEPSREPRGLRSTWALVDGGDPRPDTLPPAIRIAREIAAAVIHHAIEEVFSNRRFGTLCGMRITGLSSHDFPDGACKMSVADLGLLIEFLCSSALDEWIEQYGLHITAAAVRRHLRIHDPAAALADLAAYRASAHRIGPTRAAKAARSTPPPIPPAPASPESSGRYEPAAPAEPAAVPPAPCAPRAPRPRRIPAYLYRGGRA